jgi:hypothetical protein
MFYQTESRPQTWRALAVFEGGAECLLFVGRSTTHVRAGYPTAFAEVLDADERARVRRIDLQCWQGAADQGRWLTKAALVVPGAKPARRPALLPFGKEPADPVAVPDEPRKRAASA